MSASPRGFPSGSIDPGLASALGSRVVSAAIAFLATLILARVLGAHQYGLYGFGVSILSVGVVFGLLGMDHLAARELGVAFHNRDWSSFLAFQRWSTTHVILSSSSTVAITLVLLFLLPLSGEMVLISAIFLLGIPILALLRAVRGRFQATDKTGTGLTMELLIPNAGLLLIGISLWIFPSLRMAQIAAIAHIGVLAAVLALALTLFRRSIPAHPAPGLESAHRFDWGRARAPFATLGIWRAVQFSGYVFLAGVVLDPHDVGLYAVATRIAMTVMIVLSPIQLMMSAPIARAWKRGEIAEVQLRTRKAARLGALFTAPIIALILLFPEWVLYLFGSDYAGAAASMQILAIGFAGLVSMGPAQVVLAMVGDEATATRISGMVAVLGLLAAAMMSQFIGMLGIAIGAAAAMLSTAALLAMALRRRAQVSSLAWT